MAFKSIKKLREPQYFKTWIIRILINQSNYIYRKRNIFKVIPFEELKNNEIIDSSNIEELNIVLNFDFMCRNLKYQDRTIIILHYMENFTDKEIGKILGLKENTVTTKRTRAKKKIKDILERGGRING